ncbi:MAG: hypothetical protein HJJLKODD_02140 [Phycisphaerae bacterium]|nr:hypothetical protein [Phycisphaerae bacterium]
MKQRSFQLGYLSALVVMLATIGCKRSEPVYSTDYNLGTDEAPLPPDAMGIPYDEDISSSPFKGNAAAPDMEKIIANRPAGKFTPDLVPVIKSVLPKMLNAFKERQWDQISTYFIADQATEIQRFITLLGPIIDKAVALEEVLPKDPQASGAKAMGFDQAIAMLQPAVMLASVKGTDSKTAAVEIKVPMQEKGVAIPVQLEGQNWKIAIPAEYFPKKEILDQICTILEQQSPALLETMDKVLAGVKDGSIQPADAENQLKQAMMGLQGQLMPVVMSMMGGGAPTGGDTTAASGAATEYPEIAALITRHNEILKSQDGAQLPELLTLFTDDMKSFMEANTEMVGELFKLVKYLEANGTPPGMAKLLIDAGASMQLISAKPEDDQTILAEVSVTGAPSIPIYFKLVDGKWKMAGRVGLTEAILQQIADVMKQSSAKLKELNAKAEDPNSGMAAADVAAEAQNILTEFVTQMQAAQASQGG